MQAAKRIDTRTERGDIRPERERWLEYEREKKRIQDMNLPRREYERRIRELLDRLEL